MREIFNLNLGDLAARKPSIYYLAYGSNIDLDRMESRCPYARLVGTTTIPGHRLLFKKSKTGSYLTIEQDANSCVPAVVWMLSQYDEALLNKYEGYLKDHHAAIVSREDWEAVQRIFQKKAERRAFNQANKKPRAPRSSTPVVHSPLIRIHCGCCGEHFTRTVFASTASGYSDHRSLKGKGVQTIEYEEKFMYPYPVLACRAKLDPKKKKGEARCSTSSYLEVALEQRFMEMLYLLKSDYETNGTESKLIQAFQKKYPDTPPADKQEQLAAFIDALMALPETNAIGWKLNVNHRDTAGTCFARADGKLKQSRHYLYHAGQFRLTADKVQKQPDLLTLDKNIFDTFITDGTAYGDRVVYHTTFGLDLETTGNAQKMTAFLGYRKCTDRGLTKVATEVWEVLDHELRYYLKVKDKDGNFVPVSEKEHGMEKS